MISKDFPEVLNLERDVPTTQNDIVALRRFQNRYGPILDLMHYLRFLEGLGYASTEMLRSRKGPCGPPFEL